jgi:hypothetical protein
VSDGLTHPGRVCWQQRQKQRISPNGPRPPQLLLPKLLQVQTVDRKSPLQAEQRKNSPEQRISCAEQQV